MTACPQCGSERTLSGYCGAQGAWEVCRLRAELRDLREAVLAVADRLDAQCIVEARALRDAVGE